LAVALAILNVHLVGTCNSQKRYTYTVQFTKILCGASDMYELR